MNDLFKAVAAYKTIDHFVTSADARLSYRANEENLAYLRERDSLMLSERDNLASLESTENWKQRDFDAEQAKFQRWHEEEQAALDREHQLELQRREHFIREMEIDAQERMHQLAVDAQRDLGVLAAKTAIHNADLDREAKLAMHAKELKQNEQLELRRLRVKQQIASQSEALQKYLFEQGVKSSQELERFKALAMRETQILLARENAQNKLNDIFVQEALKTFPLNISPIVLLKNQSQSLSGLLRFTTILPERVLPSIVQVYNDVRDYSKNPEALNVFIAPIYIDSKIQNREALSQQVWDTIYQHVESFIINNYNRRGDHPVILYPTAWKDSSAAGQHASETLHFFLKDLPCVVLEPRFDGNSFSLMLSSWGLGYMSSEHFRTEMNFEMNLDLLLIKAAYERSGKSLKVFETLGDNLSEILLEKKKKLQQNIKYFELLKLNEKSDEEALSEINAVGAYTLFDIDPVQDMGNVSELISSLISLNLGVLSDVHHLQGTDAVPQFPIKFKEYFPDLYQNRKLREVVAECYKKIYIYLRNEDSLDLSAEHKREMERVREMQIVTLLKQLELINEKQVNESIEDKLRKFAGEKYNLRTEDINALWDDMIQRMTPEDIPFFKEILPHIEERRRYKQIDKKISELQLNLK